MNSFDPSKYQAFLNTISRADSTIGEAIRNALIAHNAIIAGGSVAKVYSNTTDNDWGDQPPDVDIYVHQKNAVGFVTALKDICNFYKRRSFTASAYCQSFFRKNKILCRLAGQIGRSDVDIMIVDNVRALKSVVTNFDLTFCEIWYDGKTIRASEDAHVTMKHGFLRKEYQDALFKENNHFIKRRIKKYSKRGFTIEVAKTKQPIRLRFLSKCEYISSSVEEHIVKLVIRKLLNHSYIDDYYDFELIRFLCGFKKFTVDELNDNILKYVSKNIIMEMYNMRTTTQIISPKGVYAYILYTLFKVEDKDIMEELYNDFNVYLKFSTHDMRTLLNNGLRAFLNNNLIPVPKTTPSVVPTSASLNDRFNILYANYNLLIDKNKISQKIITLRQQKGSDAFIALSADLIKLKTMVVLAAPEYNRIRTIDIVDSNVDHRGTHLIDNNGNQFLAVTPVFIKWFESIVDKLKKAVNKTGVNQLSRLTPDLKQMISDKMTYAAIKAVSVAVYGNLPPIHPYFASNHPNFVNAFSTVLHKYKTTDTEAEILKNYKVYLDKYTEAPEFEYQSESNEEDNIELNEAYNNHYVNGRDQNRAMIRHIIIMYIKLLNASNMNPQYLLKLADAYTKKHAIPYIGISKKEQDIDLIIKYELYKMYLQSYIFDQNDRRIDRTDLVQCLEKIIKPYSKILSIDVKTALYIEYIKTYILSLQINRPSQITLDELKTHYETARKQGALIINFPPELKTIIDLRTSTVGIQNYTNCVNYLMTPAAVTTYTTNGLALKLVIVS